MKMQISVTFVNKNLKIIIVYLKKITIAFHNGSGYDYHFIIKELAEEFEKQFTLGETLKNT